jgi:hypothetical protein
LLDEHRRRATVLGEAPTDGRETIAFWALSAVLGFRSVIIALTGA